MKKTTFIVLLFVTITLACTGCGKDVKDDDKKDSAVSKFASLEIGMTMDEVYEKVGEPTEDIGSGVHILVYEVENEDNKELEVFVLNFDSNEDLSRVSLRKENGKEQVIVGE